MKIKCPYCKASRAPESGIWDFFGCGTDIDSSGKDRQSVQCLRNQRDQLLEKISALEDELKFLKK